MRKILAFTLLLGLYTAPVFSSQNDLSKCTYTPPSSSNIRADLPIRLGGYFYAGKIDISWFAKNFDLLDLNFKNDKESISLIKNINPDIKIYQQFLANQIAIKQTGAQAIEGYSSTYMLKWLLRDDNGVPLHPRGPYYLMVDHGENSPWADYFSKAVNNVLRQTNSDGVVLDEIPLTTTGMFSNISKYKKEKELQDATYYFLSYLQKKISKPVIINVGNLHKLDINNTILWDRFSEVVDGAWHEGWVRFYGAHSMPHSGDSWESDIRSAEIFSSKNKPYIAAVAYANEQELEYALANYLLAIQSKSLVFQPMFKYDPITRGGFNFNIVKDSIIKYQELININLGCALGSRKQQANVWIRKYKRGLVVVNPTNKTQSILELPQKSYKNYKREIIKLPIILKPFTGLVLFNQ